MSGMMETNIFGALDVPNLYGISLVTVQRKCRKDQRNLLLANCIVKIKKRLWPVAVSVVVIPSGIYQFIFVISHKVVLWERGE